MPYKTTFYPFLIKSAALLMLLIGFHTAQSQCCTYTLSMHDSYGDGWNGGYLDVYINTTHQGTYSAANYGTTDTFHICTGDSLKLIYTSGTWETENTYQLYDPAWNLVFGDGPTPQTGIVYAATGNCSSMVIAGSHPCLAIPVDTGQCVVENNTAFSTSGFNAGCASNQGSDMWFRTTVPPSGNISIATDSGSLGDTGLAVWTDTTCLNIHSIGCDDDSGPNLFSLLTFYDLTPGQTLYIQVWGYGGATGSFKLCVRNIEKIKLDSTELPMVMINTLGQNIPNGLKINCMMDIKYNGAGTITHITDPSNVYSGHIGINIHGASSSGYPQRPFGIETRDSLGMNNNVSLLGMPAENDWLLISNYNDRSLIRNTLAHKLFGEMGNNAVKETLCEVMVDSSYQGIYVFSEKIKRDINRVNIATVTYADTTGNELTGGYILQQNVWDPSNSFLCNYSPIDHPGFDIHYLYEYPSVDSIKPSQKTYIASYIDSLETALYSTNFTDTAAGYRKYMDVKSFIDYFIVNELSRNADGFKKSIFYHKDKWSNGGKLKAGPVWDFDWAWKDLGGCSIYSNANGSGWAHHNNDCGTDVYSNGYFVRMFQDTLFTNQLRCTYEHYRQTILDTGYLFHYIDSIKTLVQHAQARHFQMWPILGTSGPAPEIGGIATTYNAEMDTMKAWITRRLVWLDDSIPGHCWPVIDHTGIKENAASGPLHYYPNPGSGAVHFEGIINSESPVEMSVYDVVGKLIDRIKMQTGSIRMDYQLHRKGVYYFKISNEKEILQQGKLIVL